MHRRRVRATMPGMVLLEREDLLDELDALRAEGGRLVFVGGEAGVGKTALVRAFAERVGDVGRGSCENLAAPAPLGPFLDIGLEPGDSRRVAAAALELDGPIVLEDVHWADAASLDVLRVLGRRIDGTGAFVLATYRDDEVGGDHPLRVVLGELASAPGVVRVSVPRLTLDAVRVLSESAAADADAIHRLTQGNAFFVTEILAAGAATLPETVRDAVLARVALLSEPARRLLESVAVVPLRAELWLLEAAGSRRARPSGRVPRLRRRPGRARCRGVPARIGAAGRSRALWRPIGAGGFTPRSWRRSPIAATSRGSRTTPRRPEMLEPSSVTRPRPERPLPPRARTGRPPFSSRGRSGTPRRSRSPGSRPSSSTLCRGGARHRPLRGVRGRPQRGARSLPRARRRACASGRRCRA